MAVSRVLQPIGGRHLGAVAVAVRSASQPASAAAAALSYSHLGGRTPPLGRACSTATRATSELLPRSLFCVVSLRSDLNPIESVWKSLRWESSPLIVEDGDEYRLLLGEIFTALTQGLSFASSWITDHLSGYIQKLR